MDLLKRIHKAIRERRYIFTDHAIEEAQDDGILLSDIIAVLLHGEIDSVYTEDIRGTRYVIRGDVNHFEVDVVCRFRSDGKLLIIITVYVVD